MGYEVPQNAQPAEVAAPAPGAQTRPESPYPAVDHGPQKEQIPAVGLPVLPADASKMPPQFPAPVEGLVIQISLSKSTSTVNAEAMTMIKGRMVPAWDPRLEAMGMSRAEFENTCISFKEVKQQGECTPAGVTLAVLGTIFCCICTICVYACVVESQKRGALANHCSALNAQQASRGFTWRMLTDSVVELKAVPTVAPTSYHGKGAMQ